MRIARPIILLSIALLLAGPGRLPGQTVPQKSAENINKLVAMLKSGAGQKEKMDACRQLGVIGTKQAVAPLAALLSDEKLSHMARYGLEPIPGREVDDAFRTALKKLKGKPLVGVIGSVGVRRDSKAVPQLALLMNSPDQEVAEAAARALGKIADRRAVSALETALPRATLTSQLPIAEGLFRCAEAMIFRGDQSSAARIYDRLLAAASAHQVRAGALRGAVLARGASGVPLLAEHLKGEDPILFLAAVKTAQEIPGKDVSDLLIGELSRPGADRQIPVMQALGKRKEAAAAPALSQIAQNGDPQARVEAVRALAEIAPPSAVPLLFSLLSDPQAKVATAAHKGLAAFPGSQADETLLTMVNSAEAQGRMAAINLIELRRTKTALPALKKAAEDPDPGVRRRALEAVGKVGEADDVPFLLARFPGARDAADIVVMEAAFSDLGIRSPDREAYASSLTRLNGLAPEQRASILRVLSILGGKNAIAAVRSSMKEGPGEVRNAAVRALVSWKTPDAAPDLLECARTTGEPSEKVLCLRGYLRLSSHDDLSLDQRVAAATEAVPLVSTVEQKRMLMSVLQRNATISSFSIAARYVDDPEVKEEASLAATAIAESIVEKNPTEVRPVMEKVLKATENERIVERAKAVLAKAGKILN